MSGNILFLAFSAVIFGNAHGRGNAVDKPVPRIVTDLKVIKGDQGVNIDYKWYNETKSPNTYPSSPGCPKSIDGYPWVHYGDYPEAPPRCYLAGYQGPCPQGEMLLLEPNSPFGICGCNCVSIFINVKPNTNGKRYQPCYGPDGKVVKTEGGPEARAGEVYDKKEKKCYGYYEQGPCEKGKVIVHRLDEAEKITCRPFCWNLRGNTDELAERDECETGMVAGSATSVGKNECENGQKYSRVLKKCIEDMSFQEVVG